jgi:hypothetical protein
VRRLHEKAIVVLLDDVILVVVLAVELRIDVEAALVVEPIGPGAVAPPFFEATFDELLAVQPIEPPRGGAP